MMSTKFSLACRDDFHFYTDGFDEGVYLDLHDVTIHIPDDVWLAIHDKYCVRQDLVRKTDAEIEAYVREALAKRQSNHKAEIQRLAKKKRISFKEAKKRCAFNAFFGCLAWGDLNKPKTKQYVYALEYHLKERDRQSEIRAKVDACW